MKFTPTPLLGAYIIDIEQHSDERGFFGRSWCSREMEEHGLEPTVVQANTSFNRRTGTLRGMHFQTFPCEEVKIVRCTRGSLFDVIVDMRPESPTYRKWFGVELSVRNYSMLYIPKQFAHGFQTLEENTDLLYLVSAFYSPDHATGILYNDPLLGIVWPLPVSSISDRDKSWPALKP